MVGLDLLIVLGTIAAVLVLQPLIALVYVFVLYRLAAKWTRRQAEQAVDGRIDRAAARLEEVVGE